MAAVPSSSGQGPAGVTQFGEVGVKCYIRKEIRGLQVCWWLVPSVTLEPDAPCYLRAQLSYCVLSQDSIREALVTAHSCQAGSPHPCDCMCHQPVPQRTSCPSVRGATAVDTVTR